MGGVPAPATMRHRPWFVRSASRLGALAVLAVFGFGVATSLALIALGALLFFALGLSTGGIVLGIAGAVVGLVYAAAQGALVGPR